MIRIEPAGEQSAAAATVVRVVAIGNAGMAVLDRLALDGTDKSLLTAVNTDIQALTSSVAGSRLQIGRSITRGLGTGGDPEVGVDAAAESKADLATLVSGADIVFLCTGLGGGTGSGVAPLLTRRAKEAGALTIVFATLPFNFEGRRRNEQARQALAAIQAAADAVVCFENDRMVETVPAKAGIHEAFSTSDLIVSQSMRAMIDFLREPGLVRIGAGDLLAALKNYDSRSVFGYGEGEGQAAAHDALARALKSPLMDRGRMLDEARNVIVHVAGGPTFTLAELQMLLTEVGRHINENTQILMGASVSRELAGKVRVTLISSFADADAPAAQPAAFEPARVEAPAPPEEEPVQAGLAVDTDPGEDSVDSPLEMEDGDARVREVPDEIEAAAVTQEISGAPRAKSKRTRRIIETDEAQGADPFPVAHQEAFQFEPVSRGRFDKSEPTIEAGEDLDVPTFMRKKTRF